MRRYQQPLQRRKRSKRLSSQRPRPRQLAKLKASKVSDTIAAGDANESVTNASLDAAFAALRKCESGGNYKTATGNGYYGAYQFDPKTWRALGYAGLPSDAPPEVQDEAARKLLAKAGWGQWPACSRKLGLR
jgi:resuscitation-promoting factor RpfA